ncbi:hypothetical protein HERIO_420 [Hepatospora eriocheir]|uniref:Uncharacterized protein n=1 Tax=Hepatospora eriocheir TaxID=1081669 RepID=A0A1X0QD59_9MICR|nr:hypothetical protein HERIO_420 [Hepatospora eriocheir]
MKRKIDLKKASFDSLDKLIEIINEEKYFQIQVFSLESVETLEYVLTINNISFNRAFTSNFKQLKKLTLLLKDTDDFEFDDNSKIILFSNIRDLRFVPYQFKISDKDKKLIINNKHLYEQYKMNSLTSIKYDKIDINKYIALYDNELIVIFSLVRGLKFNTLYNEIKGLNKDLKNRTSLLSILNNLIKHKFIKKQNDLYSLNVNDEFYREVCKYFK